MGLVWAAGGGGLRRVYFGWKDSQKRRIDFDSSSGISLFAAFVVCVSCVCVLCVLLRLPLFSSVSNA